MRHEALAFLAVALAGCGPAVPEEAARAAVSEAFTRANPPGRTGLELGGKAVWLRAPWFEPSCLEQKDLAFNDDPKTRPARSRDIHRISPTYQAQRYITASTPDGWCVYLGENPTVSFGKAEWDQDRWKIEVTWGMERPSPWFECLSLNTLTRTVEVEVKDGQPVVAGSMALAEGTCPHPLPGGEERRAGVRPATAPSRAPDRAQVVDLLRRFDNALYERAWEDAIGMVSCYNLFEEQKYGTCAVSELVGLGPLPRGGVTRTEDGPPWLENVADSVEAVGRIRKDGKDPTLYHVEFESRRGGKRTLAVQWAGGTWKLVGVVGAKAEDITTMRFVYDLDRKDKREVFERRMSGEPIDEKGYPLDPYAETAG